MTRLFTVLFAGLLSIAMMGCGGSEPSNMMEDVDEAALQDYEAMVAEDEAQMTMDEASVDE